MNKDLRHAIIIIIFVTVIIVGVAGIRYNLLRIEKLDIMEGYNRFCQNLTGNQNAAWKMVWTQCEEQKMVWYYDCCSNEEQVCLYKSTSREEC